MRATAKLAMFWQHPVTVTPREGEGAYGPIYGTPYEIVGFVDGGKRQIVNALGEEVTANGTLYGPHTATLPPVGSTLELPEQVGGGVATVEQAVRHNSGSLPLPEHVEVIYT